MNQGDLILKWIKQIQAYCLKYEEWPSQSSSNVLDDGTTSYSLYDWLRKNGYTNPKDADINFIYKHVIDENGKSIKEILDGLYNTYGHTNIQSDAHKIMIVKKIREFCKKYGEWPSTSSDKVLDDGTTGSSLYDWLNKSGYTKGEFKYESIEYEPDKSIKDVIDELYKDYGKPSIHSNDYVLEKVKQIKEYCETFNEWPSTTSTNQLNGDTSSNQLYSWLSTHGYIIGKFEYPDLKDENGIPIKQTLDELYNKYSQSNRKSDAVKVKMVKNLQEYCEKYKEWPNTKQDSQINLVNDGTTSKQLFEWFRKSGYAKGDFKYKGVVDETGRPILQILDELYTKYKLKRTDVYQMAKADFAEVSEYSKMSSNEKANEIAKGANRVLPSFVQMNVKSETNLLTMVKRVQKYCETYGEWPSTGEESKEKSVSGLTSKQLYSWLSTHGYMNGNFEYAHITDDSGRYIKDILDELYNEYGKPTIFSDKYVLEKVKQIQIYCEKYKVWPNRNANSKENVLDDGTTVEQLCGWLKRSGYLKGVFKYSDVKDENGKSIKEVLDDLYMKYKIIRIDDYRSAKQNFEEVSEFSKALNYGKDNKNENGICRIG